LILNKNVSVAFCPLILNLDCFEKYGSRISQFVLIFLVLGFKTDALLGPIFFVLDPAVVGIRNFYLLTRNISAGFFLNLYERRMSCVDLNHRFSWLGSLDFFWLF
jgi:hypothetical protein